MTVHRAAVLSLTMTLIVIGSAAAAQTAAAQSAAVQAPTTQAPTIQAPLPPAPSDTAPVLAAAVTEIEFGGRLTSISGDEARFQRYRDLRDGPTLDRFRYRRDRDAWSTEVAADHVGYRDQRYAVGFDRFGKLRTSFEWNQVPLFYSADTTTPYRRETDGVLRLDNTTRLAVQNGAPISAYASTLTPFDLRSRRDTADARITYAVTRDLDVRFGVTSARKSGEQPWAASFAFSDAVAVPLPLDNRTNDVTASAEWSNARGMARIGYDGSWFDNNIEALIWDNPLRLTDTTNASAYSTGIGSSQGRMALSPDSTAHAVSASGSLVLPRRTRAFGYVSVGSWLQDAQLLPHTINSAVTPIPLSRQTAEAEARITSMNYRLTSRPAPKLWFSGQFRRYDYDNRTPRFEVSNYVRLDGTAAPSATGGSEPFGYIRNFGDLDASYSLWRFTAVRVGYGFERDDRTFRFVDRTTEHTLRASIDSTGLPWGSARLQYDHSVRNGEGFDEEAFSEIGEQVSLRQFDISDRDRDKVSAIVQVSPSNQIGLSASVGLGRERRPDAAFGLQDNNVTSVTLGVDVTPRETVLMGASYGFDHYGTLQRSRQANPGPQFDDPTRDWATDMKENVHTANASLELTRLTARTSFRLSWDLVHGKATYLYVLTAGSTLAPPQQLAPVTNEIQRATADVRYVLSGRLALSVAYWYDAYEVDDFAMSPGTLNAATIPTFLNLQYVNRPYTAHTAVVRLIYRR